MIKLGGLIYSDYLVGNIALTHLMNGYVRIERRHQVATAFARILILFFH